MTTTPADIRDTAWPLETVTTADGVNLKQAVGLEMYSQRILRLLMTNPGELLHRPDWGVGLRRYAHKPPIPQFLQEVANAARVGLEAVSWVESVTVRTYKGPESGRITLDLVVIVHGRELKIEGVDLG